MGDSIKKAAGALQDPKARSILIAAQKQINNLGGIDQTYEKYADPKAGGITKAGVDQFLRDADVSAFTRHFATGKMHEALDELGTKDNVVDKGELEKAWVLMQALALPVKG